MARCRSGAAFRPFLPVNEQWIGPRLGHFAIDHDFLDPVHAGQVEHRVEQDLFHDRAQTAGAGFALDGAGKRLMIVSCLDNLGKGAAGQAVQNMNGMMGFQEAEGLR